MTPLLTIHKKGALKFKMSPLDDKNIQILPLDLSYEKEILDFTDRYIGKNYYSASELQEIFKLSHKDNINCSFLAFSGKDLVAVRLSYAPGTGWEKVAKPGSLSFHLWDAPVECTGYFRSLFVAPEFQRLGLGQNLSEKSIQCMKTLNGKQIIAHSWKEAPNNSSQLYFKKMGFTAINSHENYWYDQDYECTRCKKPPCLCSVYEMKKNL